jgi:hypothetical protein
MGGECGTYGKKRNAYGPLVRKGEGKRTFGRSRYGGRIVIKLVLNK